MRFAVALVPLCALSLVVGCQPSNPPPTPLPTKEKTIDKVKAEVDAATKKNMDALREAEEKADAESPAKKGY